MKVVTFGEALFRMNPPRGIRWEMAHELELYLGGSELNIAANLISLGTPASWVSVLPEGESGAMMRARLRETGVDVIASAEIGDPGWYMLEEAAQPRGDRVLARVKSVMGHTTNFKFDWQNIFKHVNWFHTSGITAGLSPLCTEVCLAALKHAKENGITTSYDLNFRKNLWTKSEAKKRQMPLLEYVDVLVCSAMELDDYFGGKIPEWVTLLMPHRDESETVYWLEAHTPDGLVVSPRINVHMTDRIGVGDSMLAGWIHARGRGQNYQSATSFAAACGALKYSVKGDRARLREAEIESWLQSGFRAMQR